LAGVGGHQAESRLLSWRQDTSPYCKLVSRLAGQRALEANESTTSPFCTI